MDYVISKSEGHLAPPFLQFCKKYDICNLSQGALTGAFGKVSVFHCTIYASINVRVCPYF